MKTSYLFLAQGFEEIEALTVVDVMRRAGMPLKTVSITENNTVVGAHAIPVVADMTIAEADLSDAEWLIAPGGMPGSTNLAECKTLTDALQQHNTKNGKIAAICAAPAVVLAPLGILNGKEATCYPGFECKGAIMRETPVVALENIITANGPATALLFALAIVANSLGEAAAKEIGNGMLLYPKNFEFYF